MKRKIDPRTPSKMDFLIGDHVRRIRLEKGLSQTHLGNEVGVTFQQIQKIEAGKNRIAASRLYRVAQALETPIAKFFGE